MSDSARDPNKASADVSMETPEKGKGKGKAPEQDPMEESSEDDEEGEVGGPEARMLH